MTQTLRIFIPFAIVLTMVSAMVYGAGQHILRQLANDPQIQIAEDAAIALASLTKPPQLPPQKIDMVKSLAPYLVLYNDRGQAVVGNVQLDGRVPVPPKGLLDAARAGQMNIATWEPRRGVRHAAVIARVDGERKGFVLAGRSLREVEKRIGNFAVQVIFIWLIAVFTTFVSVAVLTPRPMPIITTKK